MSQAHQSGIWMFPRPLWSSCRQLLCPDRSLVARGTFCRWCSMAHLRGAADLDLWFVPRATSVDGCRTTDQLLRADLIPTIGRWSFASCSRPEKSAMWSNLGAIWLCPPTLFWVESNCNKWEGLGMQWAKNDKISRSPKARHLRALDSCEMIAICEGMCLSRKTRSDAQAARAVRSFHTNLC